MKKLIIFIILLLPSVAFSNNYWVHPNGSATWANCESNTDPGSNYCSLATANSNAAAGDTVYLKGGTYARGIRPSNSGTGPGNGRIVFQAVDGESPILEGDGSGSGNASGIYLWNVDYIVVDGMTIRDCNYYLIAIRNGSDYNEIRNCTIYNTTTAIDTYWSYIGENTGGPPALHNWIHDNKFYLTTKADSCQDGNGVFQLGSWNAGDNDSNYTTIENNVFHWGGHHTVQSYTHYNVIRNNILHNEGFRPWQPGCNYDASDVGTFPGNGKYAHRNLEFQNYTENDDTGVLTEGNRIAYASANPANNGSENVTLTSDFNIIRYNEIFSGDGPAIYFKGIQGRLPRRNRVYNNTMYDNGRWNGDYELANSPMVLHTIFQRSDDDVNMKDNILKNNLMYNNWGEGVEDFTCGANCSNYGLSGSNNWCTNAGSLCNNSGDPSFTSTPAITQDIIESRSWTNPNFSLQPSSRAIDTGTHLTQANGSGSSSTTLIVDDARYFQDGTWGSSLSNIQADHIAVGTVGNIVEISSINYDTNTITLASDISWNDNDKIWLFRKSDGEQVLHGSAPDYGASEFVEASPASIIGVSISTGN